MNLIRQKTVEYSCTLTKALLSSFDGLSQDERIVETDITSMNINN